MDAPYIERNRAIKRARETRERRGVPPDGRVEDLLQLVEADGLPVVIDDFGEAVDGAYVPAGPTAFLNGERPLVRQRFTLAHELGHHVLRHGRSVDAPGYVHATQDLAEVCANAFAAELLISRSAAHAWPAAATLEDVVTMAAHFGVSAAAALIRLQTAKCAPDDAEELHARIAALEHLPLYAELALPEREDSLALAVRALPRIPPRFAGSAGALGLLRP